MLRAHTDLQFFRSRAILSWKNDTVAELNTLILKDLPGEEHVFEFVNQADYSREDSDNQGALELAVEFLQSINISSLPPAQLRLKIGTPVMLMRNFHDEMDYVMAQDWLSLDCIEIALRHEYLVVNLMVSLEFYSVPRSQQTKEIFLFY